MECASSSECRSMRRPPVLDQSLVLGPVRPSGHINLLPGKSPISDLLAWTAMEVV